MKILDLYTPMQASLPGPLRGYEFFETNPEFRFLLELARGWKMDQASIRDWLLSPEAVRKKKTAEAYLEVAPAVVKKVESIFGRELPGVLVLMPSFGDFDGFARYDRGEHHVLLGIDFPDSDVDYLKALTAHELSHVYRDHAEAVWAHLGKPLAQVSRKEYLDAGTAQEHLVSEGLATLFSQAVFPEIHPQIHHYYEHAEWEWCVKNGVTIDAALDACLLGDEDVWSFYSSNRAGRGSPSRLQYYWAAKKIGEMLNATTKSGETDLTKPAAVAALVELHRQPASGFPLFFRRAGN